MPSLHNFCPSCGNYNLIESLEPLNSTHYGRVSCGDCQHFVKWLPKPKVPEISIVKLLHGASLQSWERSFLKAIAYRNPTSAESIVIKAIEAKVNPVSSDRGSG